MRKNSLAVSWCLCLFAILAGCGPAGNFPPLQTVSSVDLPRYLGLWYEIAKLPNSFEKDCVAVTATYSQLPNGEIKVLNQCRIKTLNGKLKKAEGRAWVIDPATNAKLKVRFFWPFSGDYWILELGANYEYALVGDPSRNFLWILSREPKMPDPLYQEILGKAKQKGFDTGKVEKTWQMAVSASR